MLESLRGRILSARHQFRDLTATNSEMSIVAKQGPDQVIEAFGLSIAEKADTKAYIGVNKAVVTAREAGNLVQYFINRAISNPGTLAQQVLDNCLNLGALSPDEGVYAALAFASTALKRDIRKESSAYRLMGELKWAAIDRGRNRWAKLRNLGNNQRIGTTFNRAGTLREIVIGMVETKLDGSGGASRADAPVYLGNRVSIQAFLGQHPDLRERVVKHAELFRYWLS